MYYVFGSKSSSDADILYLVEKLGNVNENKNTVKLIEEELQPSFAKKVNVNLAVMGEGALCEVYKGTVDEVNNSVVATYDLHRQESPLVIIKRLERDVDLKIVRTLRVLLTLVSRTEHRSMVKEALRGNTILRHEALGRIDLSNILDVGKMSMEDYVKTVAFQLGQTLSLVKGDELYTKEAIWDNYPDLKEFLQRRVWNLKVLEKSKNELLDSFNPRFLKYQTEPVRR